MFILMGKSGGTTDQPAIGICRFNHCDGTGIIEMVLPENLPTTPTLSVCTCSNIASLPTYSQLVARKYVIHPDYVDRLSNRVGGSFFDQFPKVDVSNVFRKMPEVVEF